MVPSLERPNSSSSNSETGSYSGTGSGDDSDNSGNLIFHDQAEDHNNNGNYNNITGNKG